MSYDPNLGQVSQDNNLNPIPPVAPAPIMPESQAQAPVQSNTVPMTNNTIPVIPVTEINNLPQKIKDKSKIIKIIVILLVVAILVIGGFCAYKSLFSGGLPQAEIVRLEKIFDPKKPIKFKKDDKYGFISSDGKVMVEPKYDSLIGYVGDYAYAYSDDDYNSYVINKDGKVKFDRKNDGSIELIDEFGVWIIDGKLYDINLKQISPKGVEVKTYTYSDLTGFFEYIDKDEKTAGIIDSTGKITYTYKLSDDVYYISIDNKGSDGLDESYGTVEAGDKKAIINFKTGKVVRDFSNDYIYEDGNNIFYICDEDTTNVYSKETDCKSSIYVENDKISYQADNPSYIVGFFRPLYVSGSFTVYNKVLTINNGHNEKKYYDIVNKKLLASEPDYKLLDSGYSLFNCNEDDEDIKIGIKSNSKTEVECIYDEISTGSVNVYKYIKYKTNKEIVVLANYSKKDIIYDLATKTNIREFDKVNVNYYDTVFAEIRSDSEKNKRTVYNFLSDKSVDFKAPDIYIDFGPNYFTVEEGSKTTYYNTDFKKIYEVEE